MQYINETVLKDVLDLLGEIKDGVSSADSAPIINKFTKNNNYSSSIAKKSKDLIMTYPVIVSSSMDAKTATMVSKAIERKCVTMLQLLFASSTISDSGSTVEFVSKFHKNIDLKKIDVDDFIDITNLSKVDDIKGVFGIGESSKVYLTTETDVINDVRNIPYEKCLEDSINESSIQDYKIVERPYSTVVVKETKADDDKKEAEKAAADKRKEDRNDAKTSSDINRAYSDIRKNNEDFFKRQLLDTDVKKANELVPSLIIVNRICKDTNGNPIQYSSVVGVKARMISTDSYDIINRIFTKSVDKNFMLKLIRATTKEISFCKDLVFAIDKAKVDAISNSRRGSTSRMWKVLERRAIKSNIKKALASTNDASSITSLVITQEEVDYLKKNYNINMENTSNVDTLLKAYNLMAFAIVDESIEVVKFYFDGDDTFETLSFNSLERESSDGMYKKVINLMSRVK